MKTSANSSNKTFEFNWGHGIVMAFAIFILFIGTLVYKMITANVEMSAEYTNKPPHTQSK